MIRRDSTQDAERPHYYSQYWLDVAAGRPTGLNRVVEAELAADEAEVADMPDTIVELPRQEVRPAKKAAEPKREAPRSLSSLADLANIDILMNRSAEMGDEPLTDIEPGTDEEPVDAVGTDLPELDVSEEEAVAPADEDDEFGEEFVDDEEEEDPDWGGGRKTKKQPPKPPRRREPRPRF